MNIIIAGTGEVGFYLSKLLAQESHNIVIIDHDKKALEKASHNLDVSTIKGDVTSIKTLEIAGAKKADLLIAVTSSQLAIVPPYLPYHLELVYISGLFEILFGVMILFPKYRYWGSVGLILLLIAVFPANIYLFQSVEAQKAIGATQEIATWRLPVQGIFILVAYWIRK